MTYKPVGTDENGLLPPRVEKRLVTGASVLGYGGIPNSSSGAAIAANDVAFAAAAASGKKVFVPAGDWYGTFDLDLAAPWFEGEGYGASTIKPTSGHYFIDSNQQWSKLFVKGLNFDGGAGAIRNRYTGSNVTLLFEVLACRFLNYTGAAISHNSDNMPLWKTLRCIFRGANDTSTIGIALNGLTDLCTIEDCEFQKNRVDVKLGYGGNNAKIIRCDFVQFGTATGGSPRAFIWVVPQTGSTNAGLGFQVIDSKFGNENLDAADYRILYADEGAGTYFGDKMPNTGADSSGFIIQHSISDIALNGAGGFNNPLIYAAVAPDNVRSNTIRNVTLGAGTPDYLLKFRTPTTTPGPEATSNLVSDVVRRDNNFVPFEASNQIGAVIVASDPQGILQTPTQALPITGGGRSTGKTELLQQPINGFTLATATRAAITDSIGGTDAAEITFPGSAYSYVPTGSVSTDRPVWIEFELQQGSSSALSQVTAVFGLDSASSGGASNYFRRTFAPDASWRVYRYKTYAPVSSNSILLKFLPAVGSTGTKVKIGRVRMYHAYEPVPADLSLDQQHAFERRSGAIAEAFPRWISKLENLASALTSGQQLFSPIVLQAGQVVSQIAFFSGTTALVGGSNQWFGLWNSSRSKLGVTNDDTTTAWAANSEKLLTLATPYVVPTSGLYHVSCMVNATTVPTLLGISTTAQIMNVAPLLAVRDTTNTGLTNPASAPATATVVGTGSYPWAYVK